MKLFATSLYGLLLFLFLSATPAFAQEPKTDSIREVDAMDVLRKAFGKKKDSGHVKAPSTKAFLPSIGYNPSIGFQLGLNITGGKYLGNRDSTTLSVFTLLGFITTKGIITGQFRHNIFTRNNTFNFQGNWQLSKMVTLDYGPGSGIVTGSDGHFSIGGIPLNNDSATFPIKFTYIRFTERAYKNIGEHLYAGLGLSFDIRRNINDERLAAMGHTPHHDYSVQNNYDTLKYSANGLLFDFLYNTKEHPNRAYGGIYADLGIRVNQKWLGSTKPSIQLLTELRKYWSLSKTKPQHVLAFWHWGSYLLDGSIPYLELPGTGYDTYARSGRGYTIGAIKGLSFFYSELEYRYPITSNGFMSGVVFGNVQTASNQTGNKLFEYWTPAAGAGLRFLFNKHTRTNICLDYAIGRYGSQGFFFGLNEVF